MEKIALDNSGIKHHLRLCGVVIIADILKVHNP